MTIILTHLENMLTWQNGRHIFTLTVNTNAICSYINWDMYQYIWAQKSTEVRMTTFMDYVFPNVRHTFLLLLLQQMNYYRLSYRN
jgi:hypothetical protein